MPSSSFACPDCGHPARYAEDARTGFCAYCGQYTGRCEAGRRLHFPGWLHGGGWHVPCTRPWTAVGEIRLRAGGTGRARLCELHGQAVSRRLAPVQGRRMTPPGMQVPQAPGRRAGRARIGVLRLAFGKVTEEEMAQNRARYLERQRRKQARL